MPFASSNHDGTTHGMLMCLDLDTDESGCDEYKAVHDSSPLNSQDYVESSYTFEMVDTSTINLEMNLAIYEFNRTTLGFDDILVDSDDDGNPDISVSDMLRNTDIGEGGAPADLIRHFFDQNVNGDQVRNLLVGSMNTTIGSLLTGFGSVSGLSTDYIDGFTDVDLGTTLCSSDPSSDSSFESLGMQNNAFDPPICISSSATISLASSTFSLGNVSSDDLERAYRGMLAMGTTIETSFDVFADAGHKSTFSIIPPAYASMVSLDPTQGGALVPYSYIDPSAPVNQKYYTRTVDNSRQSARVDEQVSMTIGHLSTPSTGGFSIDPDKSGLELTVTLDLRQESAATLQVVGALNYLDSSTMTEWGINLLDNDSAANIPVITSDGIRMAYHNGLVPSLDDMLANFPMDAIGDSIGEFVPGTNVTMESMAFVESSDIPGYDPGGRNYQHSTSSCPDQVEPGTPLYFCTSGPNAMSDSYPIYISSSTEQPFKMELLDMMKNKLPEDPTGLSDAVDENDLKRVLDAGLVIESTFEADFLSGITEGLDLPSSSMTFEILLPTWIAASSTSDRIILQDNSEGTPQLDLDLGGSGSYNWQHAICKASSYEVSAECANPPVPDTLICEATEKTCAVSEIVFDVSQFDINEWTQSISVTFYLEAEVAIYRLMVPDEIREKLSMDGTSVDLEVLPADLLKLVLDIVGGDDVTEKLNTTIPMGEAGDLKLEVSSDGFETFASELGGAITANIHAAADDLVAGSDGILSNVDLDALAVKTDVTVGKPQTSMSDYYPIAFSISIPEVTVTIGVADGINGIIGGNPTLEITTKNMLLNPVQQILDNVASGMGRGLTMGFLSASGTGFSTQNVDQTIDPIDMSIYQEADLSFDGFVEFSLPKGIMLDGFSTSSGKATSEMVDGRQKITYDTRALQSGDSIQFALVITWGYIVSQIWIYPAILLSFVAWRVYKRKQKKAKKAAAKVKALEYRAKKGGLSDSEFTALGRGSDSMGGGMGGPPPAPQGDAWSDMGGSGYSGGAVDKELLDLYDD
ncbi:MAG TPA: hypothetical protein D7H86_03655 [Candidatus Poseidoniales archaeon]|nr:MAG TPA: hypothetical protein D7H86_03655 [Candidatus Poseidoniales archaeon]